jgi:hypothetical protein
MQTSNGYKSEIPVYHRRDSSAASGRSEWQVAKGFSAACGTPALGRAHDSQKGDAR